MIKKISRLDDKKILYFDEQ